MIIKWLPLSRIKQSKTEVCYLVKDQRMETKTDKFLTPVLGVSFEYAIADPSSQYQEPCWKHSDTGQLVFCLGGYVDCQHDVELEQWRFTPLLPPLFLYTCVCSII